VCPKQALINYAMQNNMEAHGKHIPNLKFKVLSREPPESAPELYYM